MPAKLVDFFLAERSFRLWIFVGCALLAQALLVEFDAPMPFIATDVVAIFGLLIALYRRAVRERFGDDEPEWLKDPQKYAKNRREFRDLPFPNPFELSEANTTLGDVIALSGQACVQYGRRLSVVCLRFPRRDSVALENLETVIRACVRKTDHVQASSDSEILICLNMVRDIDEVEVVLDRIRAAFARLDATNSLRFAAGAAIYPLHGYRGAELIEKARMLAGSEFAARGLGPFVPARVEHSEDNVVPFVRRPRRA